MTSEYWDCRWFVYKKMSETGVVLMYSPWRGESRQGEGNLARASTPGARLVVYVKIVPKLVPLVLDLYSTGICFMYELVTSLTLINTIILIRVNS
jgi:hypothetical protein